MISMATASIIQHVAVHCRSHQHAESFFSGILGLPKVKSTLLSKELSTAIFDIDQEVCFELYDDGATRFEVFITKRPPVLTFAHICIAVDDKEDFIARCETKGLKPFFVEKNAKQLLFVRDFSGNLFEVVER
jgi:catechol 2,3-dioxygenase-like lactoylglutathione lyase family enzyme